MIFPLVFSEIAGNYSLFSNAIPHNFLHVSGIHFMLIFQISDPESNLIKVQVVIYLSEPIGQSAENAP